MGRRELKKQHSDIDYSIIDILHKIDTTGKMVPFLIKQVKNTINKNKLEAPTKRRGLPPISDIESNDILERVLIDTVITGFIGRDNTDILKKFSEHLENNRIEDSDITQYKTWGDIIKSTTNANIKLLEKELESSVIKVIDTDEWLMVKPLTFESSLKYGANTKWCTASRDNKSYFYTYSAQGPLIYIINKLNGHRYGVCNRPKQDGVTVWDEVDKQMDSMMIGLPTDVYMVLIEELQGKPNSEYFSEEELKNYGLKKGVTPPIPTDLGGIVAELQNTNINEYVEYEDEEDMGYDMEEEMVEEAAPMMSDDYFTTGSDMINPSVEMVETDYSSEPQSDNG